MSSARCRIAEIFSLRDAYFGFFSCWVGYTEVIMEGSLAGTRKNSEQACLGLV